jgi:predicted nucleic acid-binding protein
MSTFFIDTSVFISTIKTDNSTEACERFIRRIRNRLFDGYISPYVAGEMIHAILYSDEIRQERKPEYLHDVLDAIVSSNTEWFIPQNNDLCLFSRLRGIDNRVEDIDILHATCAKILNIPLVTIDRKLLRSQGLKKEGVEILHPTQVIEKA